MGERDASPVHQDTAPFQTVFVPALYNASESNGKGVVTRNDEAVPLDNEIGPKEAAMMVERDASVEPFAPGWLNQVGTAFDFKCKKGEAITAFRTKYAMTHWQWYVHHDRLWSLKVRQ